MVVERVLRRWEERERRGRYFKSNFNLISSLFAITSYYGGLHIYMVSLFFR